MSSTDQFKTVSKESHVCQNLHFSVDYLLKCEIENRLVCAVQNCDDVFSNRSALNFHLEKVHRIILKKENSSIYTSTRSMSKKSKSEENCKCEFYCPINNCKYSLTGKRTLPTFHSLKVHFIRIHGEKKHKCARCDKSFSIKSEMERHEINCGQLIRCELCGINYSTLQSYRKHCLKKGHKLEEKKIPNTRIENRAKHLNKNHSLETNEIRANQEKANKKDLNNNQPSIIIIPVKLYCTQYTNSGELFQEQRVIQETGFENQQRSFGCQTTQMNTQETQTKINEINQQQTQTPMTIFSSTTNTNISEYEYLQDAATSTSPMLDEIEQFLNDMSTQTIISTFSEIEHPRSISIQTNEKSIEDKNIFETNKFFQTENSSQKIDFPKTNDFTEKQMINNFYVEKEFQIINNRCITPIGMCNMPSQTDEFYQNIIISTNSIETQTYFQNLDDKIEISK